MGEPEFELGESANERAKLIGSAGGERGAILHLGVHLRRKESHQEIQQVDAEAVGDDVESLHKVHAYGVDQHHDQTSDPTVENVRNRLVEDVLVPPRHLEGPPRYDGRRRRRG